MSPVLRWVLSAVLLVAAGASGWILYDLDPDDDSTERAAPDAPEAQRNLLVIARGDGPSADLEFIATTDEKNIEDQLAMLSEAAAGIPVEAETPLRLLRHYASSIRHQQYHDIDILTVRVESAGQMARDF